MRSSYGIDFDLDVDECRVSSPMSIVGPSEVGGGRRSSTLCMLNFDTTGSRHTVTNKIPLYL